MGSCAQYGLIAKANVEEGVCLVEIPRDAILWQGNCEIKTLLKKCVETLKGNSGWLPLIIALAHEHRNPKSAWKPYLDLVLESCPFEAPMFWDTSVMERELQGTGLTEIVRRDLKLMQSEFEEIAVPWMDKHQELLGKDILDLELFKRLAALIMAYSFSDNDDRCGLETRNLPLMVPVADILNHVARNNAQLQFDIGKLTIVSTKPIKKGEEIYNTYGVLSNNQLLHQYGFSEPYPNNYFDEIEIPLDVVFAEFNKSANSGSRMVSADKEAFLKNSELVGEEPLVYSRDGIMTEQEFRYVFKVLYMSRNEFKRHKIQVEQGDESLSSDSEEVNAITESLAKLPKAWKALLIRVARHCLEKYRTSVEHDDKLLHSDAFQKLQNHEKFAFHVRYGQKMLLYHLISSCKGQGK